MEVHQVSGTIKYSLSERIKNQKGDFILYDHEDDINKNKNKKFTIKEVLISPDSINNLKAELELIGISKSTIYPALTEETTKLKIQLESIQKQIAIKENVCWNRFKQKRL